MYICLIKSEIPLLIGAARLIHYLCSQSSFQSFIYLFRYFIQANNKLQDASFHGYANKGETCHLLGRIFLQLSTIIENGTGCAGFILSGESKSSLALDHSHSASRLGPPLPSTLSPAPFLLKVKQLLLGYFVNLHAGTTVVIFHHILPKLIQRIKCPWVVDSCLGTSKGRQNSTVATAKTDLSNCDCF
jgi:hypothetical protein